MSSGVHDAVNREYLEGVNALRVLTRFRVKNPDDHDAREVRALAQMGLDGLRVAHAEIVRLRKDRARLRAQVAANHLERLRADYERLRAAARNFAFCGRSDLNLARSRYVVCTRPPGHEGGCEQGSWDDVRQVIETGHQVWQRILHGNPEEARDE